MTFGTVTTYNEKRGTGFVQRHDGDRIPFALRDVEAGTPAPGAQAEYRVIGGKAGVRAHALRFDG